MTNLINYLKLTMLMAALLAGQTAQAMQIFVHRMDKDQTITLEVEPTDSYEAIKAKIKEKETISIVRQWLVYGDKKLEDGKTLSDDNIQAGSTIKLYLTSSTNGFCGVETVNGGANVTWTYNKTSHTLTIGGTGAMQDLLWDNTNNVAPATPWDAYKEVTTTIVIGNDVTYIGAYAFYGHTALTSVSIGSGVTTIGQNAFEKCTALTEITIPEGVTSIGYAVFRNCTALATVNGGNGVTSCSSSVFRNALWLELQNTVQTTDVIYFGKVALVAKEGVYGSVSIADGTVGIANNAFSSCIDLYAITIPASVTNIGQRAFFGCLYLESVTLLPATPPTMGGQAFNNIGRYTYEGRKFYFHGTAYGTDTYSAWNDMYNHTGIFSDWTTTVIGTLTLSEGTTTSTAAFVSDATSNYYTQGTTVTLGHGEAPTGYTLDGYTVTKDGTTPAETVEVMENAGVYTYNMPASDVTVNVQWTPTFTGMTLETVKGVLAATFDGTSIETVNIPASVTVSEVSLQRSFANGKYATLMLPFSLGDGQKLKGANIYKFEGVELVNNEWVATAKEATTLQANTPYLVQPIVEDLTDGCLTFDLNGGTVTLKTATSEEGSTNSDWQFKGTYTRLTYGTAPMTGHVYGFASTDKNVGGVDVKAGEFVKATTGASVPPMRCYLTYKNGEAFAGTRGVDELPQSITVRFVSSTGDTTGIGSLNTETGEITTADGWYTLSGRKLDGKPTTKGLYINNGKKVIIK